MSDEQNLWLEKWANGIEAKVDRILDNTDKLSAVVTEHGEQIGRLEGQQDRATRAAGTWSATISALVSAVTTGIMQAFGGVSRG